MNCSYCLRSANTKERDIPFDILRRILLKGYSLGYRRAGITGGEPLLYSHFDELIELLGKLKFWVFLETNGHILNEEKILFLKNHLGRNIEFLTSIDSHVEKINDLLRGNGSFEKALKVIDLLKTNDIKLQINSVITQHNLSNREDIKKHINFIKKLGADRLSLSSVVPLGRATKENFFVSLQQRVLLRKVLEENNFFKGYVLGHCAHYTKETEARCERLIQRHTAISPYGIHPCVYQENIMIGGLSDFEALMIDTNFMDSLDYLRRASLVDYPSIFLDCQDCVSSMARYLKKISKIGQIV